MKLDNKIECQTEPHAFITLRDYNENFKQNAKCRLINPAKREIGQVSKFYLARIIKDINNIKKFNQWRKTFTVIKWFQNITNKNDCRFIIFDISEFYPSISEELLKKSISFAKSMTNIDDSTIQIIKYGRKSLLFDNTGVWIKNDDNPLIYVTMGSFDDAEASELVGLCLLSKISVHIDSDNVDLYRDNGLAVIHNTDGSELDRLIKNTQLQH